jgi:hypothetical protein
MSKSPPNALKCGKAKSAQNIANRRQVAAGMDILCLLSSDMDMSTTPNGPFYSRSRIISAGLYRAARQADNKPPKLSPAGVHQKSSRSQAHSQRQGVAHSEPANV